MAVSSLWWLAVATVYLAYALSRPGRPPGCSGVVGCGDEQALMLGIGLFIGLPVMALGMALSAAVIAFRARRATSGAMLGTWAGWLWIAVLVGPLTAVWLHL
ncbi:hypothetical protein AB0J80_29160 [Actinoplanes sp. NPDC049548]|uniref:hypothetical protein n=1 Tax=Actinoplanes sp. NPDC049548 TaxID=3155152 RepID=UPI00342524FE